MKPAFDDILGNQRLRERLGDDIRSDKLLHAYILDGAEGFGKHTLALRIAAALECENRKDPQHSIPCRTCPACRKILSGNSPDVIYVNRDDKATLGVDPIRTMQNDVHIAPNECENKIYIVEDAHLMTEQAQNALLLTLEEPPVYARFFLLCNSSASLLETVKSRAHTLRLEPIPWQEIGAHLQSTDNAAKTLAAQSPDEFRELLISANGSVGTAKKLLDPKQRNPILETRAAARSFMNLCTAHHSSAAVMDFLDSLSRKKRDEIIRQLGSILVCVRDLFLSKQSEQVPLCFFAEREEATSLSYKFSAPELLRISKGLDNAVNKLQTNANARLTLISLAIEVGLLS